MPEMITSEDAPATAVTAEEPLHPDFVMPDLDETLAPRAALEKWDADLRAQARAAYPEEGQWLERACYPGPVPTVPLAGYDGTFLPPSVAARRTEPPDLARSVGGAAHLVTKAADGMSAAGNSQVKALAVDSQPGLMFRPRRSHHSLTGPPSRAAVP
ncbi:hypothetical protein [Kitasatospora sp. NBC_01300]|uniref:hypothetical protein n=1 Tax=Kitasatospora sp. NBC_01300 TaxID=2903574 RepID=UPI00352C9727|nr:hypothetical protein OG556_39895 [Kitasatospora sp. NBC_01300]